MHESNESKQYKSTVRKLFLAHGFLCPLTGPIGYRVNFYRPRKSGDLSNRLKTLEDSLNGLAWEDDSQVVKLIARRFDDKENPRAELRIWRVAA